ncbi:hypothetical protein [Selenomonas sp. ND2010]|uniref:hypothetical protein n=1 Tax=Selenomonas sp. ND2010 TaxID=1410618 RepID=UPI00051C0745|nr:hypothetical protein [Selenomonas sp. ND2010]
MTLKKLKSNLVACCFGAAITLTGLHLMQPSVASADPWIDLGYGKYQATWSVDRGSLMASGRIPNTVLRIHAVLADDYAEFEERDYRFTQQDGTWKYMWTGYTGKHAYISSGSNWQRVSGDRLANDILYIATHH